MTKAWWYLIQPDNAQRNTPSLTRQCLCFTSAISSSHNVLKPFPAAGHQKKRTAASRIRGNALVSRLRGTSDSWRLLTSRSGWHILMEEPLSSLPSSPPPLYSLIKLQHRALLMINQGLIRYFWLSPCLKFPFALSCIIRIKLGSLTPPPSSLVLTQSCPTTT